MKIAFVYLNNDRLISRGVGYLVMALQKCPHNSIQFYDTVWAGYEKTLERIIDGYFDLVMISCTSFYWQRAQEAAKRIKTMRPSTTIVVGGAHATVLRGEMLRLCPEIDYICVGEGEEFIPEFLAFLQSGRRHPSQLRNLGYRAADGTFRVNSVRPPTNLHSLPPFDHSIFNPQSVVSTQTLFPGFTYVFATRGCPFSCTYCCNHYYLDLYGAKAFLRTQSVDTVIEELHQLKANYPIKLAYFGDEMILFDREYVTELFTRVHQEIRIPYGCMFRIEAMTPEMVDLMRRTGCQYVGVGIECGDEQFRREYLNRRGTNQELIQGLRHLQNIPGMWVTTFNMRGFPVSYDNYLTEATKALNRKVRPNHVQTTWFYPIQGTPLYDYCLERDLIDWDVANGLEDYFKRSVIKRPIDANLDQPLYPRKG